MPIRNGKVVNWRHKIRLKDLLSDDNSLENANKIGKILFKRLAKGEHCIPLDFMMDFFPLCEFEEVKDVDHFNWLLDELYDYCDANLIWVD